MGLVTMESNQNSGIRMLRIHELMAKTGLSRTAIYYKQNPKSKGRYDPDFPRPVQLGSNCIAWVESEVDAWLEKRIAARKQHQQGA